MGQKIFGYFVLVVVCILAPLVAGAGVGLLGFNNAAVAVAIAAFVLTLLKTKKLGWWKMEYVDLCPDCKVKGVFVVLEAGAPRYCGVCSKMHT